MITRFLTDVRVKFNPFSPKAKAARLFLTLIPPNARQDGMTIATTMLPRASKEPASLEVKFSTCPNYCTKADEGGRMNQGSKRELMLTEITEDGKELKLDIDKMRIPEVMEQVDRHSRILARQEELSGN